MPGTALPVRQPADRQEIGAVEQAPAVVEGQALAGVELVGDIEETGVGDTAEH